MNKKYIRFSKKFKTMFVVYVITFLIIGIGMSIVYGEVNIIIGGVVGIVYGLSSFELEIEEENNNG